MDYSAEFLQRVQTANHDIKYRVLQKMTDFVNASIDETFSFMMLEFQRFVQNCKCQPPPPSLVVASEEAPPPPVQLPELSSEDNNNNNSGNASVDLLPNAKAPPELLGENVANEETNEFIVDVASIPGASTDQNQGELGESSSPMDISPENVQQQLGDQSNPEEQSSNATVIDHNSSPAVQIKQEKQSIENRPSQVNKNIEIECITIESDSEEETETLAKKQKIDSGDSLAKPQQNGTSSSVVVNDDVEQPGPSSAPNSFQKQPTVSETSTTGPVTTPENAQTNQSPNIEKKSNTTVFAKVKPLASSTPKSIPKNESSTSGKRKSSERSPDSSSSSSSSRRTVDRTPEFFKHMYRTLYVSCIFPGCSKLFPGSKNHSATELMEQHLWDSHDHTHPNICPLADCHKSFPDTKSRDQHYQADHYDLKFWQCAQCPERYMSPSALCRHLYIEHHRGLYACTRSGCNYRNVLRTTVIDHYTNACKCREKTKDDSPSMKKEDRSKDYSKSRRSGSHSDVERGRSPTRPPPEWTVQDLNLQFEELDHYYNIVQLSCFAPDCRWHANFTREEFEQHLASFHSIFAQRCPAADCDKSCKSPEAINHHLRTEHGHQYTWTCGQCHREFDSPQDLAHHLFYTHLAGTFRCPQSGCTFEGNTRHRMVTHAFDAHHVPAPKSGEFDGTSGGGVQEQGPAPTVATTKESSESNKFISLFFKCFIDSCTEFFLNSEEHDRHLREVHNSARFLCPIVGCGGSANSLKDLEQHSVEEHSSITIWKCDRCTMAYKQYMGLYCHVHRFHREGMFKCIVDGCAMSSKYRGEVIDHYTKSHQVQPALSAKNGGGSGSKN